MRRYHLSLNGRYYAGEDPDAVEAMPVQPRTNRYHTGGGSRQMDKLIWTPTPEKALHGHRGVQGAIERIMARIDAGVYTGPVDIRIVEVVE